MTDATAKMKISVRKIACLVNRDANGDDDPAVLMMRTGAMLVRSPFGRKAFDYVLNSDGWSCDGTDECNTMTDALIEMTRMLT